MLSGNTVKKRFVSYLAYAPKVAILSLALLQAGCGGGSGSASSGSGTVTSSFAGSVGDGPIVGATVKFFDRNGQLVHSTVSDQYAKYTAEITTSADAYPLTIEVEDGIDLVTGRKPDFTLTSVVENPDGSNVNINPYSTLITETARYMKNGLTRENISQAKATIVNKLNFGLDTALVKDPITSEITNENVAVMTKSSEALGEMIRRVKSNLAGTGAVRDENDVVQAFASDLSDGALDGISADAVNTGRATAASARNRDNRSRDVRNYIRSRRIAAMYRVTSAQVLIESISNNLRVDGSNARRALDDSIVSTNPEIEEEQLTGKVRNNDASLEQVKDSVESAKKLTPSSELYELSGKLEKVSSGSEPEKAEQVLPAENSNDLDEAIAAVTVATDEQLSLVVAQRSRESRGNESRSSEGERRSNDNDGRSTENNRRSNDNDRESGGNDGRSGESERRSNDNDGRSTENNRRSNDNDRESGGNDSRSGENERRSNDNDSRSTENGRGTATENGREPGGNNSQSSSTGEKSSSGGAGNTGAGSGSVPTSKTTTKLGSVSLSWTAPAARADGKPLSLSEISGYTVYYGTKAGNYPNALNINNPSTSSTSIVDLPLGTYYLVMTTRDTAGVESNYSGMVTKQAK